MNDRPSGIQRRLVGRPAPISRTHAPRRLPLLLVAIPLVVAFAQLVAASASAAPAAACPTNGCVVTVDARDFASGDPLASFNFIVNLDNSKLPTAPFPSNTESNSPIVAAGGNGHATVHLPTGRYLISVRSLDHKLWGKHITLPADDGTVRIDLTEQSEAHPLPLGKIHVFVFEDNAWTNGAPDTEEAGLNGFQVGLEEQTGGEVTVDYNNNPLCGGVCLTQQLPGDPEGDGFAEMNNLGPATYFIDVHPPDGPCNGNPDSQWYQTTTIDGGFKLQAGVEEGSDGTGAPGEQLWEPPTARTAYWFGFVCAPMDFENPGGGEITGAARNWKGWPPFDILTLAEPVENPFVALSDSSSDRVVYVGQGDADGNFDIQNVPAGTYNMAIWDEQLSYIIRFKPVTVGEDETVDANDTDLNGEVGVGVSRWFGWLDGVVYKDLNANGVRDDGEPSIANTDMDQRWRDGSIKEGTFTGPDGSYEYPTAEGGPLGKWIINEQGFARFGVTGASVHDEFTGDVSPVPSNQGGNLLTNQLLVEGHRATVDWGKVDYPAGTPGQIVGVTYLATTRNEFNPQFQAHEDYEPGIPGMTVYLEGLGSDGEANTDDDVVLNAYVTDGWQQPSAAQDPPQGCAVRGQDGSNVAGQMNPAIGPNCLEVPINGVQTKDGAFDGGYAFADYCPPTGDSSNWNVEADECSVPMQDLVAGDYIVHVLMPKDPSDNRPCNPPNTSGFKNISDEHGGIPGGGEGCLYRIVREEDVNVDLGDQFTGQIPPPPCVGDTHTLDQSSLVVRSPYHGVAGVEGPLCDKHLVVLQNGQNANADFNLMTNFRTDPNGSDPADTRTGDVAPPGRLVGLVSNDIYFERNPQSVWYGEARPIGGIPVGIYQRVDTVPNVNQPYNADNWRLFTTIYTSRDGTFDVLLPSTQTFNCPIPQGPCPGMYLVKVDDPGTIDHPNKGYDPNLLTAAWAWDVWPGLTTQLDVPLDPISGTGCEDPAVPARPELLEVSKPWVDGAGDDASRQIMIQGDFIGSDGPPDATGGRVTLTDLRSGHVTTLTRANGGVMSWTPGGSGTADTIAIQVPQTNALADSNSDSFRPGPKELAIVSANANGGISSVNGITFHVLGFNGTGKLKVRYTPEVANVAAPPPAAGGNPHAIQDAIDAASPNKFGEWPLLVLKAGVYNENVLMWKPVRLQGLGAGGLIGAHELLARDPEDPRFNIKGSVVDGRFFPENAAFFDARVNAVGPLAGVDAQHPVLRGADITVVSKSISAFQVVDGPNGILNAARIDGLGLTTGRGEGAGGIQLQAFAKSMQITNDVLENNGGVFAGGIGLGQPFAHGSHNVNVRMAFNRVIGNGGLTTSGGIGIFYDSDRYEVMNNVVCSNFSVEYGAGISHIGSSNGGTIHDNQIYYNESVDSGAGIAIESELPVGGGLGDGTGTVDVDRNLIQSNYSGDDGGAIFVLDALKRQINIRNNMIVDNGAADIGGALMLDDSSNVRIVNNTIANNVSTSSSETSDGQPHSAGLASEANSPLFQAMLSPAAPHFSNPAALFNNIFWNNNAFTLSQPGPGATLVDQGFIDFEIHGTTNNADTYTPRYSDLTNGQILGPDGVLRDLPAGQANIIGGDPNFVTPFELELTVTGSRLDPQMAAVTITGADPPVGLTGDYHLAAAGLTSPVVDRGVRCASASATNPPNPQAGCGSSGIQAPAGSALSPNGPAVNGLFSGGDFDGQYRPQRRVPTTAPAIRLRTLWDLGADELPGTCISLQNGTAITCPP